jgi:hypothetical protein
VFVQSHAKAEVVIEKEEEEEQAEIKPEGTTDEGERIATLIEQIERKDEEAVLANNDIDNSDEEGDPVSVEWRKPGFGKYSVPNGWEREWEYMENEVVQELKYPKF